MHPAARRLRVLLVGGRFLPYLHAGDKNFWLEFVHKVVAAGHDASVLSVTYESVSEAADFPCRYVRPIPVYLNPNVDRYNEAHRWLQGTNNYASRTVSFPRILRAARELQRSFRPDVIHFIDNWGPVMASVRPVLDRSVLTASAVTYNRNRPFYDRFLVTSLRSFDAVFPFSDAFTRRLRELGLTQALATIRWGVDPEKFPRPSEAARRAARNKLGCADGTLVIMWTGYTQQTTPLDFDFAVQIGRRVLDEDPRDVAFFYCFKPTAYQERLRVLERPGLRIFGTAEAFETVRQAADLLLAPVLARNSTLAPPLSWVESLALGIPVLTTQIPGADEVVVLGESGFVVRDLTEARDRIVELRSDAALRHALSDGARRIAAERFTVDRSAQEHLRWWGALADGEARATAGP